MIVADKQQLVTDIKLNKHLHNEVPFEVLEDLVKNNTVLLFNKLKDVPLAIAALNGKKISDSNQICDYQFLLIITINHSTIIEYYRVLSINRLRF